MRAPESRNQPMQILLAILLPISLLLLAAACDGDKSGAGKPASPQDAKTSRPTTGPTPSQPGKADSPVVKFETTEGTIMLELNRKKAPITVENFLNYVRKG